MITRTVLPWLAVATLGVSGVVARVVARVGATKPEAQERATIFVEEPLPIRRLENKLYRLVLDRHVLERRSPNDYAKLGAQDDQIIEIETQIAALRREMARRGEETE